MDSFEWNKVAGAVIAGLLLFMGVQLLSEGYFEGEEEILVGASGEATDDNGATDVVVVEGPSFDDLLVLAAANPSDRTFRPCQACHTANDGGANKIGPNLYGIVGAVPGSKDFAYTGTMTGKGGTWTYQALNDFLESPASAIPGTKMSFGGIRKIEDRAAIIAYLRTQSASLLPLPEVAVAEEAAPAEEAG